MDKVRTDKYKLSFKHETYMDGKYADCEPPKYVEMFVYNGKEQDDEYVLNQLIGHMFDEIHKDYTSIRTTILNKLITKVKLKYIGVHPDELYNPHCAYDIIKDIEELAKEIEGEK